MSSRNRKTTWMSGGGGLIVCGVAGMAQTRLSDLVAADATRVVTDLIFAVSILLFAFGLSRDASIVGRRPLGVTAMVVVALWPLIDFALTRSPALGSPADESSWMIHGYLSLLVPAVAGLVAATQIARGDHVPQPWRWAPMWVLGGYALTWAIPQIVFVTARPESIQGFADLFLMLGSLASLAGTLGLGVLAIVLAAQQRPRSVGVYP